MEWVVTYAAIFLIGCLMGSARSPDIYKICGVIIVTEYYGIWKYYAMAGVDLEHPLKEATAAYIGLVVVFFLFGIGGAAITSAALRLKPRT